MAILGGQAETPTQLVVIAAHVVTCLHVLGKETGLRGAIRGDVTDTSCICVEPT
jgi:hypothetical protein